MANKITAKWGDIPLADGGADYSLAFGPQPGGGNCAFALAEGEELDKIASLTLSDGENEIVLRDCLRGKTRDPENGNQGSFDYKDRRWKWRYATPVVCWYNRRDGDGNIVDNSAGSTETGDYTAATLTKYRGFGDAETSPYAIAEEMLQVLGESEFDITGLLKSPPANTSPEIRYEYANPAEVLQEVCQRYQAKMTLDPVSDKIVIRGVDETATDVTSFDVAKKTDSSEEKVIPNRIMIVGNKFVIETKVEIEPVYKNTEGVIRKITDSDKAEWLRHIGSLFLNKTSDEDERKLYHEWVFRAWRIPADIQFTSKSQTEVTSEWNAAQTGSINRNEVLPILRETSTRRTEDKKTVWDTPHVIGEIADPQNITRNITGRIEEGYRIDYQSGIVWFDRPQVKNKSDGSGLETPTLELVFAFAHPTVHLIGNLRVAKEDQAGDVEYEAIYRPEYTVRIDQDGNPVNLTSLNAEAIQRLIPLKEKYEQENKWSGTAARLATDIDIKHNLNLSWTVNRSGAITDIGIGSKACRKSPNYGKTTFMSSVKLAAIAAKPEMQQAKATRKKLGQTQSEQKTDDNAAPKKEASRLDGAWRAILTEGSLAPNEIGVSDGIDSEGRIKIKTAVAASRGYFINRSTETISSGMKFLAYPACDIVTCIVDKIGDVGDLYGPKKDETILQRYGRGYELIGVLSEAQKLCVLMHVGAHAYLAELTEDAPEEGGDVTVKDVIGVSTTGAIKYSTATHTVRVWDTTEGN